MEGEDHKVSKERVAKEYEERGFDVEKERRLSNGLIADVYAEKEDKSVIIEVGTLHGEDRKEKLSGFADEIIHVTQLGKPEAQSDKYTTVSFEKEFIEELRAHMEDTIYYSTRAYLKHLAIKEMESKKEISDEEVKKIYQKLEKLGYLDR